MLAGATACFPLATPFSGIRSSPTLIPLLHTNNSLHTPLHLLSPALHRDFKPHSTNKSQLPKVIDSDSDNGKLLAEEEINQQEDIGWLPAFPHTLVASMSNFLFGFHIG